MTRTTHKADTKSADSIFSCMICSANSRHERFNSYRGTVYQCDTCTMYYVDDQNTTAAGQEKLFYSTIDEVSYRRYFEPFRSGQYRYVLRRLGAPVGASLIDVGASYGWMVSVGRELGFDSVGLEPGDAPYDEALRGRMFRASLEDYCRSADRRFDVVTIWHVLEHLREPAAAVKQMSSLLDKGGTLVVAVPTSDGWMFRLALLLDRVGLRSLINELFYFHNPNMHFWYPNERSLRTLLEGSGLEVQWAETIEAFDWTTIWQRGSNPLSRFLLRIAGPIIKWSRFTAFENLVIVSRKRS